MTRAGHKRNEHTDYGQYKHGLAAKDPGSTSIKKLVCYGHYNTFYSQKDDRKRKQHRLKSLESPLMK